MPTRLYALLELRPRLIGLSTHRGPLSAYAPPVLPAVEDLICQAERAAATSLIGSGL
jgi:hypothetical protein